MVTKSDLEMLRYIYKHPGIPYSSLCSKFSPERIGRIRRYLSHNQEYKYDDEGHSSYIIEDSTKIFLTDDGIREVESKQWFNAQLFSQM